MRRRPEERGASIAPFIHRSAVPGRVTTTVGEFAGIDFATLPPRVTVYLHDFPIRDMALSIRRSGSELRANVELQNFFAATLGQGSWIKQAALTETARSMSRQGWRCRGYRQNPRVSVWVPAHRRGDLVLHLISREMFMVQARACELLRRLSAEPNPWTQNFLQ